MSYRQEAQKIIEQRQHEEQAKEARINLYISRAFNRLAEDVPRIEKATRNHETVTLKFDGRDGGLSGFASSVFQSYPEGEFTEEKIRENPTFKKFAKELGQDNLIPNIRAVRDSKQTSVFTRKPAEVDIYFKIFSL